MILGVVWARKRYRCVKYLFVVMITMGVAVFMYRPASTVVNTDVTGAHTVGLGEFLLVSLSLSLISLQGHTAVVLKGAL